MCIIDHCDITAIYLWSTSPNSVYLFLIIRKTLWKSGNYCCKNLRNIFQINPVNQGLKLHTKTSEKVIRISDSRFMFQSNQYNGSLAPVVWQQPWNIWLCHGINAYIIPSTVTIRYCAVKTLIINEHCKFYYAIHYYSCRYGLQDQGSH